MRIIAPATRADKSLSTPGESYATLWKLRANRCLQCEYYKGFYFLFFFAATPFSVIALQTDNTARTIIKFHLQMGKLKGRVRSIDGAFVVWPFVGAAWNSVYGCVYAAPGLDGIAENGTILFAGRAAAVVRTCRSHSFQRWMWTFLFIFFFHANWCKFFFFFLHNDYREVSSMWQ